MRTIRQILSITVLLLTVVSSWGLSVTFNGSGTVDASQGTIGFQFGTADLVNSGQSFGLTLSDGTEISGWMDIGRVAGPGVMNVGLVFPVFLPPFSPQEEYAGRFMSGVPLETSDRSLFYDQALHFGPDIFKGGVAYDVLWDGANGVGSGHWYFERSSLDFEGSSLARGSAAAIPDGGTTLWMLGLSALTIAFGQKWFAGAGHSAGRTVLMKNGQ
jgi:hypothetical protein